MFGLCQIDLPNGPVRSVFGASFAREDEVIIVVRPEDIVLSDTAPQDSANSMVGKVANRVFLGEVIDYIIGVGEHELRVRAKPEWDFAMGGQVHVTLPPAKCVGLADKHTAAINRTLKEGD